MTRLVVTLEQMESLIRDYLPQEQDRREPAPLPPPPPRKPGSPGGYGRAALAGECEKVARAPVGTRNNTLVRAAFRLGQLVAGGQITRAEVEVGLWHALAACKAAEEGEEWERHQRGTMRRGIEAGMEHPRAPSPVGILPECTEGGAENSPIHPKGEESISGPPPSDPESPLPLIYYADIVPALKSAYIVKGLLADGAMSVLYGESGCGKTFFALDLALHVADGAEWRGHRVKQRGVLYLALEGSHGICNRVSAYKLDRLANACDIPFAVVPVTLDLLSAEGDTLKVIETAKLAASTLSLPVGLIVVDTLSRAMAGGNENAPEDMTAFVRQIDLIRHALPAHVVVIHHSGKDTARGARGHSSLRAATDTEIEVSREFGSKRSLAKVTKQREMEMGAEFYFELRSVPLGVDEDGDPVSSCVVSPLDAEGVPSKEDRAVQADRVRAQKERQQNDHDDRSVLLVVDAERTKGFPGASLSWIKDHADCSERRATNAVERLVERGELVKVGPFERPRGQGAMVVVKEGYGRPQREEGQEDG